MPASAHPHAPKLSVVAPVFNEASTIAEFVDAVDNVMSTERIPYEMIIVDDGSTDDTWDRIRHHSPRWGSLRGVRFSRNFGKESAICAGLSAARGEGVVVMDADLQHPPELIPMMVAAWVNERVPIVEAVKAHRQEESGVRRIGARVFYSVFRQVSGLDLRGASDFKLLDKTAVEQYLALSERGRFFRGLTNWLGLPSRSVAFTPPARPLGGSSRWSFGKLLNFARHSLVAFTTAPLHIITWLGAGTFVGSVALSFLTLWRKTQGQAVEGFTTVILVLLCIGSILMVSLGLIGEYIARIYEEIKNRPLYVVRENLEAGPSEDAKASRGSEGGRA